VSFGVGGLNNYIPPSIDPLSDKNVELPQDELDAVRARFDIDPDAPMIAQISRFDRFKDPVGVIAAYKLAKRYIPNLQLVLAGGGAEAVLAEVRAAAGKDPAIKILQLPPDADGWHGITTGLAADGFYYQYKINGKHYVPDPASRYQPNDVNGSSQVVDPTARQWPDGGWKGLLCMPC
jgi:glycosyltransferase involved in cell wall biosynthesis